jgi:hypothetical protein
MQRVIIKQGYLKKLPNAAKLGSSFKKPERRWFIFGIINHDYPYLEYHRNEESIFSNVPLKTIFLDSCLYLTRNQRTSRYNNVFTLVLRDRKLSLVADSRDMMNEWCRAIEDKLRALQIIDTVGGDNDYVSVAIPRRSTRPAAVAVAIPQQLSPSVVTDAEPVNATGPRAAMVMSLPEGNSAAADAAQSEPVVYEILRSDSAVISQGLIVQDENPYLVPGADSTARLPADLLRPITLFFPEPPVPLSSADDDPQLVSAAVGGDVVGCRISPSDGGSTPTTAGKSGEDVATRVGHLSVALPARYVSAGGCTSSPSGHRWTVTSPPMSTSPLGNSPTSPTAMPPPLQMKLSALAPQQVMASTSSSSTSKSICSQGSPPAMSTAPPLFPRRSSAVLLTSVNPAPSAITRPLRALPSYEESLGSSPPLSLFSPPPLPVACGNVEGLTTWAGMADSTVPPGYDPPPSYVSDRMLELNANEPLKVRQVEKLRAEMSTMNGIQIELSKSQCYYALALVDCYEKVWIAGWNQRAYPHIQSLFHIGDQLVSVNGKPATDAKSANKLLKLCALRTDAVLIVRRLPQATVCLLRRDNNQFETLGIDTAAGTAEISHVDPSGLAAQCGLACWTQRVDGNGECTWWITEVNHRPLNLFYHNNEVKQRLSAAGSQLSIVVQPTPLILEMRRRLKMMSYYKDYLIE